MLHKPGIAGRGAGRPRVAAPFPRCDRVILYVHDLRQFPARLHHVRVRARLTVKTIAVASASAVPQKKAPSAAIFGVGFAFPNYDVAWKAMDGDLGAYCRGLSETVGLYCMDKAFDHGFREITMKSKPINMPDDLKGVKIRLPVAPLFIALFQHFGASPTPINFGEVYSALQTGLVDGQENPLILIDTAKLYEVQNYCSMTNQIWVGLHISFNNPPPCWRCPRARSAPPDAPPRACKPIRRRRRRRSATGTTPRSDFLAEYQSILHDNTKLAVARTLGDGTRQRTRVFSELQSHYLLADRFGRPGKGSDKGKPSPDRRRTRSLRCASTGIRIRHYRSHAKIAGLLMGANDPAFYSSGFQRRFLVTLSRGDRESEN